VVHRGIISNALRTTPWEMHTTMHDRVLQPLTSARRWAACTLPWGRLLRRVGCLLSFAAAGCQRPDLVITTLDDAATARIGVMGGSTGEQIVMRRYPQADIRTFDDIMDAVSAIRAGQLDAVVMGFPAALQVTKKNPDLTLVAEALSAEKTAIAARQTDTALLSAVNRALDSLRADGTLAVMKTRWFKSDLSPYNEPEIPASPTGTPLTIGVAATREPFSFVDGEGRVSGHDGELARRLGALLRRPVVFANMKLMALIPALQSGKIDLVVTGMSDTPERRQRVAFSTSYYDDAQRMMVRAARGAAIGATAGTAAAGTGTMRTIADAAKGPIGAMLGSAHEAWVRKTYPEATLLLYNGTPDVLLAVQQGKVEVALFDELPLLGIMQQNPAIGLLGDPLFTFDVGAGFARNRAPLRAQFDAHLAELRANGTYEDMRKRWMEMGATTIPLLADAPRPNGVLTVGVSDGNLPFAGTRNGKMSGFDIELVERFAASIGKELKLSNMEFGSLVAAVASGKVDLIISSIYITPERQQRIDFSTPYFRMDTRAFGLKSKIAAYNTEGAEPSVAPTFFGSLASSIQSNLLQEKRYLLLLDGLRTTVFIALLSTIFGTLLGALVCYMRMSANRLLAHLAKGYIAVLRGTPVLVLLMLVFYVVFASVDISPVLVAVLAFGMNFAAYVAEIFRTGIEGLERGQTEAGLAMGFTPVATFVHIVLPQTVQRILPVYKGEFISMVKMTSIVGYIAVQDLTKASDIIRSRTFDAFFPLVLVAILYFLIAWVLTRALDALERRTDPRQRRLARRPA
jgi:polar amino acid transport system substrate-binding protein